MQSKHPGSIKSKDSGCGIQDLEIFICKSLFLNLFLLLFFFSPLFWKGAGGEVVAADYYSRQSGNWGNGATWSLVGCGGASAGASPTIGDNVTICAGHTVNGNANRTILSLTIEGTLYWTAIRTINVAGDLMMNGGTIDGNRTGTLNVTGAFTTAATNNLGRGNLNITGSTTISSIVNLTSTVGLITFTDFIVSSIGTFNNTVNEDITVNGNFQNDGTFNFGTGMVTFGGASSNTVTGTSTTNFNTITVDKGTSQANVIDVQSLITMTTGGLTLTNGTFKLSNTATTIIPFPADIEAAPYLIPVNAGLWCNGGTIDSDPALTSSTVNNPLSGNWTVAGLLRISSGTVNFGTTADQRIRAENSGTTILTVEGGVFNVAGRISRQLASDDITFTMNGGIINVPTVASTSTTFPPINMDQPNSSFTMTAGTIVLKQAGGVNLGFLANAGTVGISGGTIQVGDASTPASQVIGINSIFNIAKLSVNSSNAICLLQDNLSVLQSVTINSGALDANNFNLSVGGAWTDIGTFTPGSGTVTFNGTGTQNIINAAGETFNNLTIDKPSGSVVLVNNIQVNNTLTMPVTNAGNIDCGANTITLGTSTVSTGTLTYTAGTIIGEFKRWKASGAGSLLFPVGTSSYDRLSLITFTAAVGGTLTANFVSSDPGNNGLPYLDDDLITTVQNQYTEGYWDLTAADGLSSTNYAMECTGNGFTSYSMGASTRLMYRTLSGNPWSVNGTHISASGNTAKRAAVNGLPSQFAFGKPLCSAYAAASISGNTSPCISTVESYTVNANNYPTNSYTWSIIPPAAGTITGGQTTPTVTITWGITGQSAIVQVTEQNDCGDGNPSPPTLAVTLHPIATSSITGVIDVSTNETGIPYSVTLTPSYTYSWTFPAGGGTIASGQGTNTVTVNWGATPGTYTLQVTATRLCGAPDVQNLSVTVRGPFYSRLAGPSNWTNTATWSTACGGGIAGTIPGVNDEVIICTGHTVTMNNNANICRKLTIDGTATWTANRTTTVGSGGVIINSTGNITGTGAGFLLSEGGFTGINNANISSGTVTIRLQTNPQNITSTGALNRLDITSTATNTGTVTITNILSGAGALTQAASSTLNMNGTTFTLTTLNASATGNLVNYGANATQTITATTYDNLTVSGIGTKTLGGVTTVNRNLAISSASTSLDVSTNNYALTVGGNWNNAGAFTERFGTVTFNGASSQTITATGGETFNNLAMSGAGAKNMSNPLAIDFDFTLSSTLNTNNNDISIRGNFDNSGTYNTGTNNVTFTNNTTILGSSATTLNNVIISATLKGSSSNMNVTGNWTNNGTFTHNGGTVTLTGAAQTIGGISPNTFNNLTIAGTGIKTLGAAITTDGDLTINSTLNVSASSYSVNVKGNWVNNGIFAPSSGTVIFNGTTAQTIGGTTTTNNFYNITQSNAAGVSLAQHQNLLNTLTISTGTFTTTGYNFALKSTSSRTARIAAIPAGSDFIGNLIMERYTGTGPIDWRFFSSAVSGATIADWDAEIFTSGFTGADCSPADCATCGSTCNWPSIYWYDETQTGNLDTFGFVAVTNVTNPIIPGRGYWVYLGPNPVTFDVKGTPNKFIQTYTVTYTPSTPPDISNDGWNLITNSYPSAIDWDDPNWTRNASVDNAIYIWNSFTGSYATYVGGLGVNGGSQYIGSQQAFYVKTNAAGPSISKVEAVKTASENPSYPFLKMARSPNSSPYPMAFRDFPVPMNTNTTPNSILLTASGNGYDDETFIIFRQGATNGFDGKYDAWKLLNTNPAVCNLSSVMDDTSDYSINNMPPLTSTVDIPIRLRVPVPGTYTIRRDSIMMLPMSSCLILEDKATGTMTDLRTVISYSFTISDTTAAPRFILHIYPPISKQAVNTSCTNDSSGIAIAKGTGTGTWNYVWKDSNGNILQTTNNSSTSDSLFNLTAGIYSVVISSSICGTVTDTIIVKDALALDLMANFTDVSCNGQNDGTASVSVSGGTPPYNYLWSNGATSSQISNLISKLYSITVTDAYGCTSIFSASVSAPVVADFDFNKDTLYLSLKDTAFFTNASSGALLYLWDFGDTSVIDSTTNPIHYYSFSGTYMVTLIASDSLCFDTVSYIIVVMDSSLSSLSSYPPPLTYVEVVYENGEVFLSFDLPGKKDVRISVYNMMGERILVQDMKQIQKNKIKLPVSNVAPGVYVAVADMNDAVIARKIIIR